MRQHSENLFNSSIFLNSIIDCANFSIIATDHSGIIRHFNTGAENLLGYKSSEVTGNFTPLIFHETAEINQRAEELSNKYSSRIEPGFQVIVKKAEVEKSDERIWNYITKDKRKIPVKLSVTTLKDESGNFIGFLFIAKDYSEESKFQQEVSKLKRFNEMIIENAGVWINALDNEGNVTVWNKAAENISGYSKSEVMGNLNIWELLYPIKKYREEVFAKALSILNKNEVVEGFETKIKSKSGEYKIISWNSKLIKDENNLTYGSLAIGNDITKLKRYEMEESEIKKKLQQKNKDLENVIYVTSHDLRSPLVNIQGFSSEVSTSLDEIQKIISNLDIDSETNKTLDELMNQDIKEANSFIHASVLKMNSLLNGLLKLSRLGRSLLQFTDVDMNDVLDEILKTNEFRIKENNIEIIKENLPVIKADRDQVSQIFSNLISNAIKYRNPVKESYIKISGRINDSISVISVSDNGIGIDDEHIDKIFEIFYQLNPEKSEGEGLGLSIVSKLVDKHNGNITVESESGVGTTFHITFPVV